MKLLLLLLMLLTLPEVTHWNDMQDIHGSTGWTGHASASGRELHPTHPQRSGTDHWPAPSQTIGLAQRQPRCLQTPLPIFCETLR